MDFPTPRFDCVLQRFSYCKTTCANLQFFRQKETPYVGWFNVVQVSVSVNVPSNLTPAGGLKGGTTVLTRDSEKLYRNELFVSGTGKKIPPESFLHLLTTLIASSASAVFFM